jgi:hypothetical protein
MDDEPFREALGIRFFRWAFGSGDLGIEVASDKDGPWEAFAAGEESHEVASELARHCSQCPSHWYDEE